MVRKSQRQIVLILHNIRSAHNVGSILRSADGFGARLVYLCGYTPYPETLNDSRLPFVRAKINKQIQKTALGAQNTVEWRHLFNIELAIQSLKKDGYNIVALEQSAKSIPLNKFRLEQNLALIVGNEVEGIDQKTMELSDMQIEIPMHGSKESFNVAVAAAVALYELDRQRYT